MRKAPALLAALAVAGGVTAAVPASAAADGLTTITASHPVWASAKAKVADASPSQSVTFRVYLSDRNTAAAESLAQAMSSPGSSSYRKYLSTDQVKAQFAPSGAEVDSVRNWLRSAGFSITDVPDNNAYVEAAGAVNNVDSAFKVHLGEYKVAGLTLRAADTDLSVPASLASSVLSIIGIDQSEALMKPFSVGASGDGTQSTVTTHATSNAQAKTSTSGSPSDVPPPAGFRNAAPCSSYYGQKIDTTDPAYNGQQLSYAPCGYIPAQLRSAYGIDKTVARGVDGKGTTVAIVDAFASPTLYADAAEYAKRNDPQHPLTKSQFTEQVFPPTTSLEPPNQCGAAGWYGEQSLDVEAVHAMAPGANILYVGGSDCQDLSLDKALNYVVAGHRADLVSNSYGDAGEDIPADYIKAFNTIALHAVLEGIGLYFSSGDSGDEAANLGYASPDFSASDPWVTAVGGTSLGIDANGRKVFETGWESGRSSLTNGAWSPAAPGTYLYGSGGGTSRLFAEPFYQKGVVPDALAAENQSGTNRGRVVPDISMLGDPNTGFLIGITQTFPDGAYYDQYRIGGTSLASPLFAGLIADADQLDGFHHGFLNPVLYGLAGSPLITDVKPANGGVVRVDYTDGTDAAQGYKYSVRTFDYPNLAIHTTAGYDNTTGLGTPSGAQFLFLP